MTFAFIMYVFDFMTLTAISFINQNHLCNSLIINTMKNLQNSYFQQLDNQNIT